MQCICFRRHVTRRQKQSFRTQLFQSFLKISLALTGKDDGLPGLFSPFDPLQTDPDIDEGFHHPVMPDVNHEIRPAVGHQRLVIQQDSTGIISSRSIQKSLYRGSYFGAFIRISNQKKNRCSDAGIRFFPK